MSDLANNPAVGGPKQRFSGYFQVFCLAFILFMHLGTIGTVTLFIFPVSMGLGVSIAAVILKLSISSGAGAIFSFFGTPIVKKMTPRWALLLASFLGGLRFIGFYFSTALWQMYIFTVLAGIMMVLGTNSVVSAMAGSWFIERRAAVLGAMFSGAAAGNAFWQLVSGFMITNHGWRMAYLVQGVVLIVVCCGINLLFIRTPQQKGQKPLGWEKAEQLKAAAASAKEKAVGVGVAEALKTKYFWVYSIGIILSVVVGNGIRNNVSTFLQMGGMTPLQAGSIASAVSAIGIFTAFLGGMVAQKFGMKVYLTYLYVAFFTAIIVLLLNVEFLFILIAVYVVTIAFSGPMLTAMNPTIASAVFGNKDYTGILTTLAPAMLVGLFIAPTVTSIMLGAGLTLAQVMMILLCVGVVAFVVLQVAMSMSPWMKLAKEEREEKKRKKRETVETSAS